MAKILVYGTEIVTDTKNRICVAADVIPPPPDPESYFTFHVGTGTITGYSPTAPKAVAIPATIGGVAVRSIGFRAFYNLGVTSLILPTGLELIDSQAFAENPLLTQINVPHTVTQIKNSAFYVTPPNYPTLVTSIVNLPADVTIYGGAFAGRHMETLVIPNNANLIVTQQAAFQLQLSAKPHVIAMGSNVLLHDGTKYVSIETYNYQGFYAAYQVGGAGTYTFLLEAGYPWVKIS